MFNAKLLVLKCLVIYRFLKYVRLFLKDVQYECRSGARAGGVVVPWMMGWPKDVCVLRINSYDLIMCVGVLLFILKPLLSIDLASA